VFARGLKTKIAVNIAILLFLGMLLIDLVTIVTIKRELIRAEVFKANMLLFSFEKSLLANISADSRKTDASPSTIFAQMLGDPQLAAVLVLNRNGLPIFEHRIPDIVLDRLIQYTKAAMSSNRKEINFTGTIWSLFFKQTANLTLAAPLLKNGEITGGISVVLSLDRVYQSIRNSQKIFGIYLFINLAILTYVGIYRISKLYLLPLGRLAKRADEYK
jgi:hypothetical protein